MPLCHYAFTPLHPYAFVPIITLQKYQFNFLYFHFTVFANFAVQQVIPSSRAGLQGAGRKVRATESTMLPNGKISARI
jgi:hypothetical protein